MTEIRGMKMVEPSGIEPLTSTMPLSLAPDFPPFSPRHLENAPRTGHELKQFSVPLGPKSQKGWVMSIGKRNAAELINGYWLDQKRGRNSGIWCAAWYDQEAKTVRYRSLSTRDKVVAEERFANFVDGRREAYRPAPAQKPTEVYFICGDYGAIKIGASHDPRARLEAFSRQSPIPLRIAATTSGGLEVERAYHIRFAAHRLHGEWFERHPDILAEIDRLNIIGPESDWHRPRPYQTMR